MKVEHSSGSCVWVSSDDVTAFGKNLLQNLCVDCCKQVVFMMCWVLHDVSSPLYQKAHT